MTARAAWRRALLATAAIAALFCAAVAAGVFVQADRLRRAPVANAPLIAQLKQDLTESPGDVELQRAIREYDQAVRARHLRRVQSTRVGAVLLLCGGAVIVAAVYGAGRLGPDRSVVPAEAAPAPGWQQRIADHATLATAVFGAGLAAVAFGVGLYEPPQPTRPSVPEIDGRWTRFRGNDGLGQWHHDVPLPGIDGAAVLWRTRVPLPGKGSPVIWGNHVFLAGGSRTQRAIVCVRGGDGKVAWQADLPRRTQLSDALLEMLGQDTGLAAATPCCDDQHVYMIYPNGDVCAVAHDGSAAWTVPLGQPANTYGLAASPLLAGGKLIVPFDQRFRDDDSSRSALLALSPADGAELWRTPRPVGDSWTTPIVIPRGDGQQIITAADPWVISYDLDGKELWRAKCMSGDVAPSPIYAGGVVLMPMAGVGMVAIDPTGSGDVTETHIRWTQDDGAWPDIISPVAVGGLVLTLETYGGLGCYRIADGKKLWDKHLDATFYASPIAVGPEGRDVLFVTEGGRLILAAVNEEGYEERATAELDDTVFSTPVFADGRMFVRGTRYLHCIGRPELSQESDDE